jgi:purine-cytosine permease-like protein
VKLKPTRILDVVANVLIAALVAWIATRVAYDSFPPISIFAGASLYPVAAIEAVLAFVIRARVNDHEIGDGRHQLHPITAARAVALAKASAQVGSIAAGIWLGFLCWVLPQRGTLRAAAADSPGAIVGMLAGVALVAAALWLEYCCRAPEDPTDDAATT